MVLMERDYRVFRELERWRYCLGRHIQVLCGFSGSRAANRRLKILFDAGYIGRKKLLYGFPSLYILHHPLNVVEPVPTTSNSSAKGSAMLFG